MSRLTILKRLLRDSRGAAAIEFALLAPSLILLLFGVLTLGVHMQSYNSARSIVYDLDRYTVVQYQTKNEIGAEQIAEVGTAIATSSPYNFPVDRLRISAEEVASGITGAKRFDVTLSYVPLDIPLPLDLDPPTIVQTQAIIVPD